MFEIGWSEYLLIFALALIVLGPEKLPKVAAAVGRWVGRARVMARQFRDQLENESGSLRETVDDLKKEFRSTASELQSNLDEVQRETASVVTDVESELKAASTEIGAVSAAVEATASEATAAFSELPPPAPPAVAASQEMAAPTGLASPIAMHAPAEAAITEELPLLPDGTAQVETPDGHHR
jgi:sec-independent protein translocase protein TatB